MALSESEKIAIKKLRIKLSRNYSVADFIVFGSKATNTDVVDSELIFEEYGSSKHSGVLS
jgi:predicted nucleotidyltransferase